MKKGTWNHGSVLPPGTLDQASGCVPCCPLLLSPTYAHLPASSVRTVPATLCFSYLSVLFIHSLTQPMSTCWRPSTELCAGNTMPSGPFQRLGAALSLTLPWQDLSLSVSESDVRVIPADKISPRLKLPVSSYLHQPISTCLSILMAYGSRGESPNERKLATVLIGLKKTTGGEVFLKNTHKNSSPRRCDCNKNDDFC